MSPGQVGRPAYGASLPTRGDAEDPRASARDRAGRGRRSSVWHAPAERSSASTSGLAPSATRPDSESTSRNDSTHPGVEQHAGGRRHVRDRSVGGPCRPVGALGGEGVPDVRDRDDSRGKRDLVAGEVVGVSGAVPPLVVEADGRERIAERPGSAGELPAHLGVALDPAPLVGVELAPGLFKTWSGTPILPTSCRAAPWWSARMSQRAHADQHAADQAIGLEVDGGDLEGREREAVTLHEDRYRHAAIWLRRKPTRPLLSGKPGRCDG